MYLIVSGIVNDEINLEINQRLNWDLSKANRICVFVLYSEFTVHLSQEIIGIYIKGKIEEKVSVRGKIKSVTQQLLKEFEEIPQGWKVILLLEFETGIPEMISRLPKIDSWFSSKCEHVILEISKKEF